MPANPEKVKGFHNFRFVKAVRASALSPKATAMAYALAWRASFRTGVWRASQSDLCQDTKMSRASVQRALAEMRRSGFVEIVRRTSNGRKDWNEYRLQIPAVENNSTDF